MESSYSRNQVASAIRPLVRRLERPLRSLLLVAPVLVLVLSALHAVSPRSDGILALTEIFAPYLFLALMPLVPLAFTRHGGTLRWALLACALVFAARFGPDALNRPRAATPGAPTLAVLSWNAYVDNVESSVVPTVTAANADIVALQELTAEQSAAIRSDPTLQERYPWQILKPNGARGLGLLSRYPIVDSGERGTSAAALFLIWARLDVGGQEIVVGSAHPRTGVAGFLRSIPLPVAFDPTGRDAEIADIRATMTELRQTDAPLLLMGDFNTTDREPTYRSLTAGLQDAQREVGLGLAHSWRPKQLLALPLGLLRIDYLLSSPELRPLRMTTDCALRGSDHCALHGTFELNPAER